MKKSIFFFFLLISANIVFADDFKVWEKIKTKYGELRVVRKVYHLKPTDEDYNKNKEHIELGSPTDLMLHGKVIFHGEFWVDYVTLLGVYNLKDGQAVLIDQNCGGSSCGREQLSFVVLKKDIKPYVVTDKNFNSETNTTKVKTVNNILLIDLGYYNQKRKYVTFDGNKLSFKLVDEHIKALDDEVCEVLYKASNSCIIPDYFKDRTCENYVGDDPEGLGGVGQIGSVRWVSHHPGFNKNGYAQECLNVCKAGQLSDYDTFKKNACVQP